MATCYWHNWTIKKLANAMITSCHRYLTIYIVYSLCGLLYNICSNYARQATSTLTKGGPLFETILLFTSIVFMASYYIFNIVCRWPFLISPKFLWPLRSAPVTSSFFLGAFLWPFCIAGKDHSNNSIDKLQDECSVWNSVTRLSHSL